MLTPRPPYPCVRCANVRDCVLDHMSCPPGAPAVLLRCLACVAANTECLFGIGHQAAPSAAPLAARIWPTVPEAELAMQRGEEAMVHVSLVPRGLPPLTSAHSAGTCITRNSPAYSTPPPTTRNPTAQAQAQPTRNRPSDSCKTPPRVPPPATRAPTLYHEYGRYEHDTSPHPDPKTAIRTPPQLHHLSSCIAAPPPASGPPHLLSIVACIRSAPWVLGLRQRAPRFVSLWGCVGSCAHARRSSRSANQPALHAPCTPMHPRPSTHGDPGPKWTSPGLNRGP